MWSFIAWTVAQSNVDCGRSAVTSSPSSRSVSVTVALVGSGSPVTSTSTVSLSLLFGYALASVLQSMVTVFLPT